MRSYSWYIAAPTAFATICILLRDMIVEGLTSMIAHRNIVSLRKLRLQNRKKRPRDRD